MIGLYLEEYWHCSMMGATSEKFKINQFSFADDTAIVAESDDNLR